MQAGYEYLGDKIYQLGKAIADFIFATVSTDYPPIHAPTGTEAIEYPPPPFEGFSTKDINIAFIGYVGNGKSSIINAYLDKKRGDPDRAPTGFVETTGLSSLY